MAKQMKKPIVKVGIIPYSKDTSDGEVGLCNDCSDDCGGSCECAPVKI